MTVKYFYRSDFSFPVPVADCCRSGLPLEDLDFEGMAYTAVRPGVRFFHRDGRFFNCYLKDGQLFVVCDRHGLAPGDVKVELRLHFADDFYSDGDRAEELKIDPGVRLTDSPQGCGCGHGGSSPNNPGGVVNTHVVYSDKRFSQVVRGVRIESGAVTKGMDYSVVWVGDKPSATEGYVPPTGHETPMAGRFAACQNNRFFSSWPKRDSFCGAEGLPLEGCTYLCEATGRRYLTSDTKLLCISAPPSDSKRALFNDLWNELCNPEHDSTPSGFYDPETDEYVRGNVSFTYAEALAEYYRITEGSTLPLDPEIPTEEFTDADLDSIASEVENSVPEGESAEP